MDIGTKIKNARIAAHLTQEQVAEALGVSRQTMSNWENGKTYPDIVSVIKMSDLYAISLDHLLKEKDEIPMSNYMDYLEESTNTVRNQKKLSMTILIATYLGIWAFALIMFWFFINGSDAMGYSLVFLWIILPAATFVISLLIGKNNHWGKGKWLAPITFGIMHMLAEYATFSMRNMIAISFTRINVPHFELILVGAIISAIGLGIGSLSYHMKSNRKKQTNLLNS
ncbi:MAG: helix-turn-helix transcriptional regulator [Fusicatenibacter sp.]|nr:helix-turn-helix transcriptional regulator [Fusicatenibacter sp.]